MVFMADKVAISFHTGRTLTFTARQKDGTLRGTAGQSLSEEGSTGHYSGTPDVDLEAGDIVTIFDSVWGPVMFAEYLPEVVSGQLNESIELLAIEAGKQQTDYDETRPPDPVGPRFVGL